MNTAASQVGNLDMITDDATGSAGYSVWAQRPTMYDWWSYPNKSILDRAMVIYAGEDDFGATPADPYSYFLGSMTRAVACCNIRRFIPISGGGSDFVADDDDFIGGGRRLHGEDLDNVEFLNPEQYKEIFGVEYDPEDWKPENFTQ